MSRAVLVVDDDRFIRKLVTTTLEDVTEQVGGGWDVARNQGDIGHGRVGHRVSPLPRWSHRRSPTLPGPECAYPSARGTQGMRPTATPSSARLSACSSVASP